MEENYDRFLRISESVAGEFGDAFLVRLVDALKRHLDVSFVAITVGEGTPPDRARAIFANEDGEFVDELCYALEGEPCQIVYEGKEVVIPCDVARDFPSEEGFESYIGLPLRSATPEGVVIGHIMVMSRAPLADATIALATLRIFAQRAQAELQRIRHEAERDRLLHELTELNGRLRRNYMSLHDENAQKSRLMSLIAHDLRSPLSALMCQAELGAARNDPGGRNTATFERILANAERISDMIQSTLERIRQDGASIALNKQPTPLAKLLKVAVEANRDAARSKSILIEVMPCGFPAVMIDEVLMVSAIDNLVSNAVKYTPCGGSVQVLVETGPGEIVLCVTDNGQGLNEEDMRRAFGRFQTLSARPTAGESSTGLGLANVREIAEAHGGRATVHSEGPGRGATFRIHLPFDYQNVA